MTGAGAGVVWDKAGHIVTNFHVVRDSQQISVTVGNGLDSVEYNKTRVLGVDPDRDIAVIEIVGDEEHPVKVR